MSLLKQSVVFCSLLFSSFASLPAKDAASNPPDARKDSTMAAKAASKSPAASENPAPNASTPPAAGAPNVSQKDTSLKLMESMARTLVTQNIVRLNITAQAFDFARPWSKRAPMARKALGTVLPGNLLLCTAEAIANST